MDFYKGKISKIFDALDTNEKGLSSQEVEKRFEKYGHNKLKAKKQISPIFLFLEQFKDPVIWVLIGALVISIIIGYVEYNQGHGTIMEHATEPIVIGAIVIANAVIGFLQEYKAEKAIEALKKMASLKATVIRDGKQVEIDAEDVVPGDILVLSPGEKIPADARLMSLTNLQTQEAALTGESLPVKKEVVEFEEDLQLGDRTNMVFSGTVITEGKGKAIVVKTGMDTEIGKIAQLIESAEETLTPLQKRLEKLGKFLTYLVLGICVFIFTVLTFSDQTVLGALITAVSLAVAAIPEGLPAVVTISLALGVQRMVKKNALIRKLPSVETLGSTTVICTDKTGTLTKNEMTVKKIYVDDKIIEVGGSGYVPEGNFSEKTKSLDLLMKIGILNNDSELVKKDDKYSILGDPTEGSLLVSAEKAGFDSEKLRKKHPRIDEIMFDSKRKRMTTVHNIDNRKYAYVKGAPDIILGLCDKILVDGKEQKLTKQLKDKIMETNDNLAGEALRVLGFAYREVSRKEDYEKNLIFVGLQGMIDPPREEVKDAIRKCRTAGIKVVMITGDYKGTAMAIAEELDIRGKSITGKEIENIDLDKEVDNIGIYARVNPEHKMKIVQALQRKGHVVAMTGDGVNDAPALKSSDIGIAMGITGTDVAKESSDMILTDDNFASIVNAVEEGRGIYDNIKKFMQYLLSSNLGEVLVLFLATVLASTLGFIGTDGHPVLPLLATQILWMNLVTDGLPAVALGMDPAARNIMKRKPRKTDEGILTKSFGLKVAYTGIIIAIATLFMFWYYMNVDHISNEHARTMALTTLVILQFVRIHIIRSEYDIGMLSNKSLIVAVIISIGMQLLIIYTALGNFFETVPIRLIDWGLLIGVSIFMLIISAIINKILFKKKA